MLKVIAIVVTYNGMKWYDRCFGSLLKQLVPIDVVAIDNASSDGTVDYIRKAFPQVHLIESDVNLGFAKANNIGIRYALDHGADYVLLLNHDAWFESVDGVDTLIRQAEDNPQYWIMSPLQLYPGSRRIEDEVKYHFARNKDESNDFISDAFNGRVKDVYSVEYACAFCWLLPVSTVRRIGGFDPLFYHYGEDDNYQQRVKYHGGAVGVCPEVTVCHDTEGRSEDFRSDNLDWRKYLLINYCDINMPLDMRSLLNSKFRGIIVQMLRFCRKHLKESICEFRYLRRNRAAIEYSRSMNRESGANWL